jgi:hypothetical protein
MQTLSRLRSSCRALFGPALVFSLFALSVASPAGAAPATYTYTGNPFTTFTGTYSCPPECSISGDFTVSSPLTANLSYASTIPTGFSFTDGNTTWNLADTIALDNVFLISTDAAGNITNWRIVLDYNSPLEPFLDFNNSGPTDIYCPNCFFDETWSTNFGSPAGTASNGNDPGCWATSPSVTCSTAASTPEPGSLVLLGTGLFCALGVARVKLRHRYTKL